MNYKYNVLYILDIFPKISETFILNEILALQNNGVVVHVVSIRKPSEVFMHEQISDINTKPVYFDDITNNRIAKIRELIAFFLRHPIRFLSNLVALLKFDKDLRWNYGRMLTFVGFISKNKIQHIHAHFAGQAAECAMCLSAIANVPYSFTTHGYDVYFQPHRYYKELVGKSKFTIAVSRYNSKYLVDNYGVTFEKLKVVRCGINTEIWQPINCNEKDIDLVTVARLHPVKGLNCLLEACCMLTKYFSHLKCVIIGDGDERKNMEHFIRSHGLENNVLLVGAKKQTEVRCYLSRSRVFVITSKSEAMPVSVMEAMAMKLPVVATDVRGVSELVEDSVNGILVDPGAPDSIADAIVKLLGNPLLRTSYGEMGRCKIESEFNINEEIDKFIRLLTEDK